MNDKYALDCFKSYLTRYGDVIPLATGRMYMNREFIESCIVELEKLIMLKAVSLHEFTPLERLAIDLLFNDIAEDIKKEYTSPSRHDF